MKPTDHARCFQIFSDNPQFTWEEAMDAAVRAGIKLSNARIEHVVWYCAGCGRFGPGKSDRDMIDRNFPNDSRPIKEKANSLVEAYLADGGRSLQECYAKLRQAGFGSNAAWGGLWERFPGRCATDRYDRSMFPLKTGIV